MPQAPVPIYRVEREPSRGLWLLSGPVVSRGSLLFGTARESASHARWAARCDGGVIEVYDPKGQLFKKIEVEADETINAGYVLPSV